MNHMEFLNNRNRINADHLGHSPSVKFEDTRKQAKSRFNRPYSFTTDAKIKRRVPHEETHINIFHEDKDFTVYDMDPNDESLGARKKRANFHLNQKHHFLHHSNEDHLSSGAKERDSTPTKKGHERKHHHFNKSTVLECHSSWQGESTSVGLDESHEPAKVHTYSYIYIYVCVYIYIYIYTHIC